MTNVLQGVMYSPMAAKDARYETLAAKLVAKEGRWLVPMPEDNLEALVSHGKFYAPASVEMVNGPPSECHMTSAFMVTQDPKLELHTGYALSNDGKWRQHSWVMNPEANVLVEVTNQKPELYFGLLDPNKEKIVARMRHLIGQHQRKLNSVLPGLPS